MLIPSGQKAGITTEHVVNPGSLYMCMGNTSCKSCWDSQTMDKYEKQKCALPGETWDILLSCHSGAQLHTARAGSPNCSTPTAKYVDKKRLKDCDHLRDLCFIYANLDTCDYMGICQEPFWPLWPFLYLLGLFPPYASPYPLALCLPHVSHLSQVVVDKTPSSGKPLSRAF
jgi:hypothetical protein